MNTFLPIVFAVIGLTSALPDAKAVNSCLPNFVFIFTDDLGCGDVGCYNPDSEFPTPNLDRLATEGMRFTDAHSPATVCTPSRYSLLTGQMAFRVPRGGRVFTGAGGPSLIADDRLTLPEMLPEAGYTTAAFGMPNKRSEPSGLGMAFLRAGCGW